ncbi:MAG: hypothetical protein ACO3JL_01980 [Myxococcota bacterium]
MSTIERYRDALESSTEDGLVAMEAEARLEVGIAGVMACLEEVLVAVGTSKSMRASAARRLGTLLCELALFGSPDDAVRDGIRATALFVSANDEHGAARATAITLRPVHLDRAKLDEVIVGLGGPARVTTGLKMRLKHPDLATDDGETAFLRHTLALLAERAGDLDRAFLELLRAVRKAPHVDVYREDAVRLGHAAGKHPELEAVLSELAQRTQLDEPRRATLWSQAALLREVHLEDAAGALRAYQEALALRPESKAARRHADRLAVLLGNNAPLLRAAAGPAHHADSEGDIDTPSPPAKQVNPPTSSTEEVVQASVEAPGHVGARSTTGRARHAREVPREAVAAPPSADTDVDWAPLGVPISEQLRAEAEDEDEGDVFAPVGRAMAVHRHEGVKAGADEDVSLRKKSRRKKKREARQRRKQVEALAREPTAIDAPRSLPELTRRVEAETASPSPVDAKPSATGEGTGPAVTPTLPRARGPDLSSRRAIEAPEMRAETRVVVSPLLAETPARPALETLLAQAEELVAGDDAAACLALGKELLESPARGAWVLRLSARVLALSFERPEAYSEAVDLFVEDVPGNGPKALELAQELHRGATDHARRVWLPVWIAVVPFLPELQAVAELLSPLAEEDAPYGVAFRTLDQLYAARHSVDARHVLWRDAFARTPSDDEARRRALLLGHIRLLEDAGRWQETLPLFERLTLEVAPVDEMLRNRAITAWEAHAPAPEQLRFLERLAARTKGAQAIGLLGRVLQQRLVLGDRSGAELTARRLLELRPGDVEAVDALCSLLDGESSRVDERAELLLQRFEIARRRGGPSSLGHLAEELITQLDHLGRVEQATSALHTAVLAMPDDEAMFGLLAERLRAENNDEGLVALCVEVAERSAQLARKVSLLLMASETSHRRLRQHSTAHAFIEQALALAPDHPVALLARAELADGLDDATGALVALERLVGRLDEPVARAQVHHRIARIYEEQLLKPEDAARRYRAAIECDPSRLDSHQALVSLAAAKEDVTEQCRCLLGLAKAAPHEERLAALRQLVRLAATAPPGGVAVEEALRLVLEEQPDDTEALEQLMRRVATRLTVADGKGVKSRDVEAKLASDLHGILANAVATARRSGVLLPDQVWRMHAVALAHQGRVAEADLILDGLLKEKPTDLQTLWTYAEVLEGRAEAQAEFAARRKQLLETALLHHAPSLPQEEQLSLYSEVGILRWNAAEERGAQATLAQALSLVAQLDAFSTSPTSTLEVMVEALRSYEKRSPHHLVDALRELARRGRPNEGAACLEQAARIATVDLKDRNLALTLLQQALALEPDADGPRKALVALEIATGNTDNAIGTLQALATAETDEAKRAQIHLQLAELYRNVHRPDAASKQLVRALRLDPANAPIQRAAEEFFQEQRDPRGLEALFTAQLRHMPREQTRARIALLERLAQVRRYELRDLTGAAEALAAVTALDPESVKAYEDLARVQMELALYPEAAAAWRAVLARDPLYPEAWRSLFSIFARSQQGDEAYAVAASMVAVELADDAMTKAVRNARPPFPRWPRPRRHAERTRRLLGHPLEASPLRVVMEIVGPALQRVYGRTLGDLGVSKRERLVERQLPSGVLLALRTATQVVGLTALPPLYRWTPKGVGPDESPFRVMASAEPALAISEAVLTGGMTPERAFALGRAVAWLMPHALPAATLSVAQLKAELSSLLDALPSASGAENSSQRQSSSSGRLENELFRGLARQEAEALKMTLHTGLKDYKRVQDQVHLSDWMAGVNYTADRLGFLMCNDLMSAVRFLKANAASGREHGVRLAIRELVLFSVSTNYLTLRRELQLSLPEGTAKPLLDL